ncbi:MAG TPA: pyridoxamine 5'-phosphate oxidase family protein [Gemmatimonadaceae bacterium]|nr:pyridoxamine 5'-phosphate oxidase family protein [Gemmatimonadaceae bacterium]
MALTSRPRFGELPAHDAIALLGRNHVGRLAFTFHDRVDIEPISYAYDERYIYARTSPGTKLTTMQHHPWVAFEVDEVEGQYDWRSVTVRGALYFLEPAGSDRDREAYDHAVEVLRAVDAEALTAGDPAPHRTRVFRIFVDELTGRQATTST